MKAGLLYPLRFSINLFTRSTFLESLFNNLAINSFKFFSSLRFLVSGIFLSVADGLFSAGFDSAGFGSAACVSAGFTSAGFGSAACVSAGLTSAGLICEISVIALSSNFTDHIEPSGLVRLPIFDPLTKTSSIPSAHFIVKPASLPSEA